MDSWYSSIALLFSFPLLSSLLIFLRPSFESFEWKTVIQLEQWSVLRSLFVESLRTPLLHSHAFDIPLVLGQFGKKRKKKKKRKRQAWYAPSYAYHYAYRRGTSSTTFRRLVDHLPSLLSRTTRVAEPRVASKPIRRRSSPPIKLLLNTRERTTHDSLLLSTGTSGSRAENRASLEPGCCRLERKRRYARTACRCLLVFKIRVAPRIDPRHCLFVTIRVTHVAACFRSSCSCARDREHRYVGDMVLSLITMITLFSRGAILTERRLCVPATGSTTYDPARLLNSRSSF